MTNLSLGLSSLTSRNSQRVHRKAKLTSVSLVEASQVITKSTKIGTAQLRVFKTFDSLESFAGVMVPTNSAFGLQDIPESLESSAKEEIDTDLGAVIMTSHILRIVNDQNWIVGGLEFL